MSLRFFRRVKIGKHATLNFSKSGVSVTVGRRRGGPHITTGPKGTTTSFGIPGTGISWREHTKRKGT